MALLCTVPPLAVATQLCAIKVPGVVEQPSDLHVSIVYLTSGEVGNEQVAEKVMRQYASLRMPFDATVQTITHFPASDDGTYPIVGCVESPMLHKVWAEARSIFSNSGVLYDKTFPDFRAHITLAYADEPLAAPIYVEPITWVVDAVEVWYGDWNENGPHKRIPLGSSQRRALRHVMRAA